MTKVKDIMKITGFKNFMSFIAATLSFLLILSAIVLPGCMPYGVDNGKKDIASDNTGKKDGTETTEDNGTAEVLYKNAPQDFSIKLKWNTGSLPPPYNYSYDISCGSGLNGSFEYQGGHGLSQTPEPWITDFDISADNMDDLYVLLEKNDFFRDKWEKSEPSIGGSYTIIKISANSKNYEIPPDFELKTEDTQKINEVADFINSLVPEKIWIEMQRQQSEFEKSYEEYEN